MQILLTFNKLPFAIKIFVLSIFERPLYTGFIVYSRARCLNFDLSLLLHPYLVHARSEGSGESAYQHKLARASVVGQYNKYKNHTGLVLITLAKQACTSVQSCHNVS